MKNLIKKLNNAQKRQIKAWADTRKLQSEIGDQLKAEVDKTGLPLSIICRMAKVNYAITYTTLLGRRDFRADEVEEIAYRVLSVTDLLNGAKKD